MHRRFRSSAGAGLLLILVGAAWLAVQFVPGWQGWVEANMDWPWIIVGVGVLLLVFGILIGAPGMAIPACIVGGLGGLFWWQNATDNWESWSYTWALIPGFVGVGIILNGLLEGEFRSALRGGGWMILISLILFAAAGSLFGELEFLGVYWPILLILLGLLFLAQVIFRPRR